MIIDEKAVELAIDNAKWKVYSGVFLVIAGPLILFIQSTYGALALCFVVAGVIVILHGKNDLQRLDDFYVFKEFIGNKNEIRIEDLAKRVQSDKYLVVEDLIWMTERGYFQDVEIDSAHEFFRSKTHYRWKINTVSANTRAYVEPTINPVNIQRTTSNKAKEEDVYYSEVCDCCGGTTRIKVGGGGVCDYCRAPIGKYKKYQHKGDK